MSSFSDAKLAVEAGLRGRSPDNGMEAMWIRSMLKALSELTEETMASEERVKTEHGFDQHVAVSKMVRDKIAGK
jgi:hypothetical protein